MPFEFKILSAVKFESKKSFLFINVLCYNKAMLNLNDEKIFLSEEEVFLLNPQSLAFLGDGVFSLYVRHYFCYNSTAKSGVLHKQVTAFVKATSQSFVLEKLLPILNERELALVKRARNVKVNNIAKHATIEEYKKSTAFEAILGYLYLSGQAERLNEILEFAMKAVESTK